MAVVTNKRKREILDSAKGQIFSVVFIKSDGSERHMQCKKFVERMLASGDKNVRQKSTTAHKENLYTVADIGAADAFRTVNLDTLIYAKVGGIEYRFDPQPQKPKEPKAKKKKGE